MGQPLAAMIGRRLPPKWLSRTGALRGLDYGLLYDKTRPGYEKSWIATLLGSVGEDAQALDVGGGTGKLALVLQELGYTVEMVEPDAAMARVARNKGLPVHQHPFERARTAQGAYDLVTCGQAWHWLDPRTRELRALKALKPGGRIFLVWNLTSVVARQQDALAEVYLRVIPSGILTKTSRDLPRIDIDVCQNALSYEFQHISRDEAPFARAYSTQEWLDLALTEAFHRRLPFRVQQVLLREIQKVIEEELEGRVDVEGKTIALMAEKCD